VKKKVDKNISMVGAGWSFNNIEKEFDKHIKKSVPFYDEIHRIILKCSEFFTHQNAIFLDIGCSTGTLLNKFSKKYKAKYHQLSFIGIDNASSMIKEARKNNSDKRINFKKKSILDFRSKKKVNLITSVFTIQFINPEERKNIFNNIYKLLCKEGAFILFEKVLASNSKFQNIYNGIYDDFKRENNFTEQEIAQKSLSLRGKLESLSSLENSYLLKEAGFVKIDRIFKWFCFEGTLCIK